LLNSSKAIPVKNNQLYSFTRDLSSSIFFLPHINIKLT
jgi:hypothetical protein